MLNAWLMISYSSAPLLLVLCILSGYGLSCYWRSRHGLRLKEWNPRCICCHNVRITLVDDGFVGRNRRWNTRAVCSSKLTLLHWRLGRLVWWLLYTVSSYYCSHIRSSCHCAWTVLPQSLAGWYRPRNSRRYNKKSLSPVLMTISILDFLTWSWNWNTGNRCRWLNNFWDAAHHRISSWTLKSRLLKRFVLHT